MQSHGIRFENRENNWSNGLPLGNGVFGTMVYYKKNKMFVPLNHYEVYYNISPSVLPQDQLKNFGPIDDPGATLKERCDRAAYNIPKEGEPYTWYGNYRNGKPSTMPAFSGSYPQTGDLTYSFDGSLKNCDSLLALDVEKAAVTLNCTKKENGKTTAEIKLRTVVARKDCVITNVKQSRHGLLCGINLSLPPVRDAEHPKVKYIQLKPDLIQWQVIQHFASKPEGENFVYSGTVKLVNATAEITEKEFGCDLKINGEKDFTVICAVCTSWRYKDPAFDGARLAEEYATCLDELYKEHTEYWDKFFSHSSISLPDKFLERVYCINQYALECCSGENGVMKHHACGLNGLWDVKRPTLWGSLWYWDVNIQAAFAGVFSSNHMHLGKVFSDGLNLYTELARKYAYKNHNKSGIAFDYPYMCYFSVWPWCAQYLWQHYEYTMDLEYLRNEAYPLFLGMCEFALQLFEYDEEKGKYFVYPDISPEQGPLSHNTTITIGATKKFLSFTLQSAKLLDDRNEMLPDIKKLYDGLPDYPTTEEGGMGKRFKDSEEAPANLWIRHPGMMMPVFPAGEIGLCTDCSEEMMDISKNTLEYLEDHCETGIFGGSWLAAAAARLGQGQKAIRLLYERGMDHMLRSNGLSAEENDRFINLCLTMRQPIYYPCMMEYTGEMLAAVNEMLLQSFGNAINVFPALPTGDPEYSRMDKWGFTMEDYPYMCNSYPEWKDVRINTLRARGAFLVTAQLKEGNLKFIELTSLAGGTARVTSPYLTKDMAVWQNGKKTDFTFEENIICFNTQTGGKYLIATSTADWCEPENEAPDNEVVYYESAVCKRRVYLGENEDCGYQLALDNFTRDRMFGDLNYPICNVYRFDFGERKKTEPDYNADRAPQTYWGFKERTSVAMPFLRMITPEERKENGYAYQSGFCGLPWHNNHKLYDPLFTVQQGFGFKHLEDVTFGDREKPDCLRSDFAEGSLDNEYIIEVTPGEYELVVCSGDNEEDSLTTLSVNDERVYEGEVLPAGKWQLRAIPFFVGDDELVRLKISTKSGYKWKLNYILVNQLKRIF